MMNVKLMNYIFERKQDINKVLALPTMAEDTHLSAFHRGQLKMLDELYTKAINGQV